MPNPPATSAELMRSPFREASQHSQRAEVNGLLDAGCFAPVDEKDVLDSRKIVASRLVHINKIDHHGHCVKTKSRLVINGFS